MQPWEVQEPHPVRLAWGQLLLNEALVPIVRGFDGSWTWPCGIRS